MANGDLIEAVHTGDVAAVARLVTEHPECAAERDERGVSALLHACYLRRQDIVDVLLLRLEALDLLEAAAVGDSGRVERLLGDTRVDVDRRSGDGFTALHYAAFFGRPEVADALIAAGADVAAVASNPMAVQPLHSAAATSQRDVAGRLLAAGADPNARQHGGYVPLHSTAQNGDEALTELLLEHGADPTLETDDGRSAAAIARTAGHEQLAQRLERGAQPSP
jgi:ankyrin repeat protein